MAVKKHVPYFKSTRELRKAKGTYTVAGVTGADPNMEKKLAGETLSCRLTNFNMPVNTSVANYIKDGLTDELDAADKFAPKGSAISVVVNKLESDTSGFNTGDWQLDFNYVMKGKSYNVKTKTEFESAYSADTACRNTANALTDALTENFTAFYKKMPH
jgi:hypothetical protein